MNRERLIQCAGRGWLGALPYAALFALLEEGFTVAALHRLLLLWSALGLLGCGWHLLRATFGERPADVVVAVLVIAALGGGGVCLLFAVGDPSLGEFRWLMTAAGAICLMTFMVLVVQLWRGWQGKGGRRRRV